MFKHILVVTFLKDNHHKLYITVNSFRYNIIIFLSVETVYALYFEVYSR